MRSRPQHALWLVSGLLLLTGAAVVAGPVGPAGASSGAVVLQVAVGGSGEVCSVARPCGVQAAVDRAGSGDVVLVQPGEYPSWDLRDRSGHLAGVARNVVVKPAVAGSVNVAGVVSNAPHLTFAGLKVGAGGVQVKPAAKYTVLDGLDVDGRVGVGGAGSLVGIVGSQSRLLNSRVHDAVDRDLVFLGSGGQQVTGLVVKGNEVGPSAYGPAKGHVDCLQMGGMNSDILIEGNVLFGCSNASVIIKADYGPIDDVRLVNNVLQGCLVKTVECGGYYALYVVSVDSPVRNSAHFPVTRVVVAHNTIDGAVALQNNDPAFSVVGNIIGEISPGQDLCAGYLTFNLLGRTGCTRTLGTNRVGQPMWADRQARDYRVQQGSLALALGGPAVPTRDVLAAARSARPTAGAYENTANKNMLQHGGLRLLSGDYPNPTRLARPSKETAPTTNSGAETKRPYRLIAVFVLLLLLALGYWRLGGRARRLRKHSQQLPD